MTQTPEEAAEAWLKEQVDKHGNWLAVDALEGKSFCTTYNAAFLAGWHAAQQAQWVSVKEGLPEENEEVLIAGVFGVHCATLNEGYWSVAREYEGTGATSFVTHWKPRPEPPKEEKHG